MTEEKRNRLIAAVTVNVIILIAVLAVVCIYQIVEMVTLGNLKKDLQDKVNYYNSQGASNDSELDYFKDYDTLLNKAYEYGWVFPND